MTSIETPRPVADAVRRRGAGPPPFPGPPAPPGPVDPVGPTADLLGRPRPARAFSLRRLLPWLAGADERILRNVPWERTRYSVLGAALLVPPTIGMVGITVMLHMVSGATQTDWRFVGAGAGWGVVVIFVDRLLIRSRIGYRFLRNEAGEPEVQETPSKRRITAALWAVRILMAVSLGIFASEPMLAALYGSEAAEEKKDQLDASREARIADAEEDGATAVDAAQESVANQIQQLEAQNALLAPSFNAAQDEVRRISAECNGENLDGGAGRGPGAGPVYQACLQDLQRAEDAQEVIEDQIDQNTQLIVAAQEPVQAARDARAAEVQKIEDEEAGDPVLNDLGAWERITLTHDVLDWWYRLSLTALILCLDALAILGKGLLGKFAHDDLQAMASAAAVAIWSDTLSKRVGRAWDTELDDDPSGGRDPGPDVIDLTDDTGPTTDGSEPSAEGGAGATEDPGSGAGTGSGGPTASTRGQLLVAGRIISYDLVPIGVGTYSTVHRAHMPRLSTEPQWVDGEAVVKLAKDDDESRRMLRREMTFYESHVQKGLLDAAPEALHLGSAEDGSPLLLMRHYRRQDLVRFLLAANGEFRIDVPVWLVLAWLRNLVALLEDLWGRGLLHGDGKPDNILVNGLADRVIDFASPHYVVGSPGSLRLCDFASAGPELSDAETYTREYSPPEYETGARRLTRPGDVYSLLGAVGHFIVTGAPPDRRADPTASMLVANPALASVMPLVEAIAAWLDRIPERRVEDRDPIGDLRKTLDRLEQELQGSYGHMILRRPS